MAKRRRRRPVLGASCAWDGPAFDTRYGAAALDYLRERSRRDPWFAIASAVMHAGQIDYNTQQPMVEEVVKAGPAAVRTFTDTAKLTAGAQEKKKVLVGVPQAARCYTKIAPASRYASADGMSRESEELIECLRGGTRWGHMRLGPDGVENLRRAFDHIGYDFQPETGRLWDRKYSKETPLPPNLKRRNGSYVVTSAGVGPKTRNLAGEYLGCNTAVAVDRHVANWLANTTGRLAWTQRIKVTRRDKTTGRSRGSFWRNGIVSFTTSEAEERRMKNLGIAGTAHISRTVQAAMKKEIIDMASGCGVRPAELQVAAWAQGVCDSLGPGGSIYLGDGARESCAAVPRYRVPLSDFAAPVKELPAAPPEKFKCGAAHLGRFGQTAVTPRGLVPVHQGPMQPPPDEVWTYEYSTRLQPVRVIPRARLFMPPKLPAFPARRPATTRPRARRRQAPQPFMPAFALGRYRR